MKKRLLAFFSISLLLLITGCGYNGYSGKALDLYTVAINSVLWNNGHSFSADRYKDSEIEIMDEDSFGRTLFTYYEKYYYGGDLSFSALIICQKSTAKYVYYYEDINYIVMKQDKYAQSIKEFDSKQIEQLKQMNDWNQELNLERCVKKDVSKNKPDIPYEKQTIKNKIIEEFNLTNQECSLFINFLTWDLNNSSFIIYGYIWKNNEDDENIYFISLVNTKNDLIEDMFFLIPSNPYNYQLEYIEFKETNGWIKH